METKKLEKSIKEIFENGKYVVPLYQRNYAWRKDEIEQLLQDVYESFLKNRDGYYFIGSLVVLKRQNGDFEVIDGQQRLTTLSLITKILGISKSPCLFYDSRPEVEAFFKEFYNGNIERIDYPQTTHLKNAVMFINEANLDANSISSITINNLPDKADFIRYFSNNVILVRVEIPEDTDVASYFEIMNNRGVQLQKHEILKSLLIAKLANENEQKEFAQIWNACSQMNTPIQRAFKTTVSRKKYFGEKYDNFVDSFEITDEPMPINPIPSKSLSIEEILSKNASKGFSDNNDEDDEIEEEVSEYNSIIDFPNFLMHVLKLKYQTEEIEIPLNEKYLLSVYDKIKTEINSIGFIKTLFFCRVVFDRFIVKTITDKNVEDEIKWTLRKPTKNDNNSWKFTNSFGDSPEQDRIVKALSMLQITFRTRIYKSWLQDILKLFVEKGLSLNIDAKDYIKILDELILKYYDEREIKTSPLSEGEHITKENSYSEGQNTPHFIFNFIDYLYWVDSKSAAPINKSYKIEDFEFKYWNSVEHHMAREWAERNNIANSKQFIDCLGNLCLISKGANSRLSDRDVKEKVQTFGKGNLGAKRQIMYAMSKYAEDKYTWNEEKIKQHYNKLLTLLSNRENILKTEPGK